AAELAPDLVALGGDFVSHVKRDLDGLASVLARFRARDGVVAVLGNHDHWVGPDAVGAVLARASVALLTNRHVLVRRGAATLAVAGVDDFSTALPVPTRHSPVSHPRSPASCSLITPIS